MESPDPHLAAIAIAREAQHADGLGHARKLLLDYCRDGLDPLRLAYAACQLLAVADYAITDEDTVGEWLTRQGLRTVAARVDRHETPS